MSGATVHSPGPDPQSLLSDPPVSSPAGFVACLRDRTQILHTEAERTGVIRALLRGTATREAYTLLLRNLLPAYREIEAGLEQHRDSSQIRVLARPELYRSAALIADLEVLAGRHWAEALPLLPAGQRYQDRIRTLRERDSALLVAHGYVRYFGDLSGGQILKRLLARTLGLAPAELSFYRFSEIPDARAFKADLRDALDRAAPARNVRDALAEEAALAFRLTIDLSKAVEAGQTLGSDTASQSFP